MAHRQHLGLLGLALLGAIVPIACGEDAGKAPEAPSSGGDGGNGGKGGSSRGGSNQGGSSRGGSAGDQAGDGGTGGDVSSTGGEAGDASTGGSGGKGGSGGSSTGGTGGSATSACEDPWSEPNDDDDCDIDGLPMDTTTMLTGDITSNLTLASGKAYQLSGPTRVTNNAVLTIQPCVRIEGQSPTSVLAILPGSKIEAAGEENKPIVFTSAEPAGSRAPGDWGGLIVLGNARVNQATSAQKPSIEGLVSAELYGSHTDSYNTESSGTLTYVRVEYTGRDLGSNNETNGVTLGGVGSGTTIHHVMSSNSIDDCFEWFGGTVSAHHLIAVNCDDDMFDTDFGFSGSVQFAFGRAYPTSAESDPSGFEMDSNGVPLTTAKWSNATICGNDSRTNPRVGMLLKNGVGGDITNTVVTGFHGGVVKRLQNSSITLSFVRAFGNDELIAAGSDPDAGPDWFFAGDGNDDTTPSGFCDCWANPPNPFPVAPIPGTEPPSGAVDPGANYLGAFEDAQPEHNWMTGKWVDWSED